MLPSLVWFSPHGAVVGEAAREGLDHSPDLTIFGVKRLLGRRFDHPDIRKLAQHFLAELSIANKTEKSFNPEALAALERHSFPGNVRELKNAVQQAFILAEDVIGLEHLPSDIASGATPSSIGTAGRAATSLAAAAGGDTIPVTVPAALADVERSVILATLEKLGGDKAQAAERLGISLKTLYSRLREYSSRSAVAN